MGQEFFIKSDNLESKVRSLLPSQGGLGQGIDLSASTQIVPIVDLTESAEGSNFRQDLQTAFSFDSANTFNVSNALTQIINNTGYWRVFASIRVNGTGNAIVTVSNGLSNKDIFTIEGYSGATVQQFLDVVIFNPAGYTISLESTSANVSLKGNYRQIADINGDLVNP